MNMRGRKRRRRWRRRPLPDGGDLRRKGRKIDVDFATVRTQAFIPDIWLTVYCQCMTNCERGDFRIFLLEFKLVYSRFVIL